MAKRIEWLSAPLQPITGYNHLSNYFNYLFRINTRQPYHPELTHRNSVRFIVDGKVRTVKMPADFEARKQLRDRFFNRFVQFGWQSMKQLYVIHSDAETDSFTPPLSLTMNIFLKKMSQSEGVGIFFGVVHADQYPEGPMHFHVLFEEKSRKHIFYQPHIHRIPYE